MSYGVNGLSFVEIVTAIERLVNEDCAVDWGGEGKDFITSKYDGKALDIYIYIKEYGRNASEMHRGALDIH